MLLSLMMTVMKLSPSALVIILPLQWIREVRMIRRALEARGNIGNTFQRPPFSRPGQFGGGELVPEYSESWERTGTIPQPRQMFILGKEHDSSVTARIKGELETEINSKGRVEPMCRRLCLLAQEESQLVRTKLLMKEQRFQPQQQLLHQGQHYMCR
jgi:hypothetical protein